MNAKDWEALARERLLEGKWKRIDISPCAPQAAKPEPRPLQVGDRVRVTGVRPYSKQLIGREVRVKLMFDDGSFTVTTDDGREWAMVTEDKWERVPADATQVRNGEAADSGIAQATQPPPPSVPGWSGNWAKMRVGARAIIETKFMGDVTIDVVEQTAQGVRLHWVGTGGDSDHRYFWRYWANPYDRANVDEWTLISDAPEAPAEKATCLYCGVLGKPVRIGGFCSRECEKLAGPLEAENPPEKAQETRHGCEGIGPYRGICGLLLERTRRYCAICEATLIERPSGILVPQHPPEPYVPRITDYDLIPEVSARDTVVRGGR